MLIGRAAGIVGDAVWMSVAFSAVIAVATAFSYAELSSILTTAASTYTYVAEAFPKSRLVAFMAAWMLFFGGVAGAATTGLGFSSYFVRLFGLGDSWIVPVTFVLLVALSFLNWWGRKESAALSAVFTVIEAGGLLFVSLLSARYIPHRLSA
uniref:Amino acid permease n=1 Tax=Thermofilum adornatum TaxID=1365176 RepID=A0A7C1G9P4_9CREN